MNVLNTADENSFKKATQSRLLEAGLEELRAFSASAKRLRNAFEQMKTLGDENAERRADRMCRQIDTLEPSITMIGQIKSGKTSLVNALVGAPDLLPADVNPWTSVVTSLHLYPETPNFENSASFRFFDADEWDKLISGGGRIGELASRAGADEELEKIKQQVAQMREKSRTRLGRKFEMLLGQQRDYGYFDQDLIERYVCLGDEPDAANDPSPDVQGRFADITKSADLRMQRAALPMRLCIRDTPGVNDTFMMREQITIRAIRDSRICVVVLSAHQALSSTDMALIRLISHVKSRDVIIFVNRVDELSDPSKQIPQIHQSIRDTLSKHKGPEKAEVIFGSALWASYALQMRLDELPKGTAKALQNWAQHNNDVQMIPAKRLSEAEAWHYSGLPALQAAVSTRICQGMGAALLQRLASSARNVVDGLAAADRIGSTAPQDRNTTKLDAEEARGLMTKTIADQTSSLEQSFDDIVQGFSDRMTRVQESFLDRATASLLVHLEQNGEQSQWTYDPAGLRVLLSSSHKVLARKSQAAFDAATAEATQALRSIYSRAFPLGSDEIQITAPKAPRVPAPVSLGRTIALDLSGSWWKRWWLQRRGYKAYAQSFYDLIKSETDPVIAELRDDLAGSVRQEASQSFEAFLSEQMSVFETLEKMQQASPEELQAFVTQSSPKERKAILENIRKTLNEYDDNE